MVNPKKIEKIKTAHVSRLGTLYSTQEPLYGFIDKTDRRSLIYAQDLAMLRCEMGKNDQFSRNGNYVREGYIEIPGQGKVILRNSIVGKKEDVEQENTLATWPVSPIQTYERSYNGVVIDQKLALEY
ncbi:MAG: hypothetical protein AABY10_02525 [Nanoarchaeota archaeon]